MSDEKALNRIETMLESIRFIEELCEENGGIVRALEDRRLTRPAIMMHLISIQEQMQKLQKEQGAEIIKSLTHYHLKGLTDTRNVIAHNYEGIDLELIENTIRFDLPKLKDEFKQILSNSQKKTSQEALHKELEYYEKNKNSFYQDARLKQENLILALYKELKDSGKEIDEKSLKMIETIIKERANNKNL